MKFRSYFYSSLVFFYVILFDPSQAEITCLEGDRAKKFNDRLVEDHNKYRNLHDVPPLKADSNLMTDSIKWCEVLAKKGSMEHSRGLNYGENLYMSWASNNNTIRESEINAVKRWYDEIKLYHPGQGFSHDTGHYTQVVWKATRKVGCGVCLGSSHNFVTCRYNPPGNVQGQFDENVLPPKSKPSTTSRPSRKKTTRGSKSTASDSENTTPDTEKENDSNENNPNENDPNENNPNENNPNENDHDENDDDGDNSILLFIALIPFILLSMLFALLVLHVIVFNQIIKHHFLPCGGR